MQEKKRMPFLHQTVRNHIHHIFFLIFSADLFCKVMQVRKSNIILNIYNYWTHLVIIATLFSYTQSSYGNYTTNSPQNENMSKHTNLVADSWWKSEAWTVCVHSVWESGKRTAWETVQPDERRKLVQKRKRSEIMKHPESGVFNISKKKN